MAFSIPNLADAAFPAQAQVDAIDVAILVAAHNGNRVISDCAVTAQGSPDMTVAVASGSVLVNSVTVAVSSGNVTVTAADGTNPRFDLIVVNDSGTKSCTAGTAAASPVFPSIPSNSVVLAAVYVPANDTDIDANQIIDKRVIGAAGGGITEDSTMWSPDAPPASAGSQDDEFLTPGAGAPTGWTERDHGSTVTVAVDEEGLSLSQASLAGADSVAGVTKSVDTGAFVYETEVSLDARDSGLCWAGISLWQDATSSSGDIYTFDLALVSLGTNIYRLAWGAYNSIAGQTNNISNGVTQTTVRLRIAYTGSGTTYKFYVGNDGHWLKLPDADIGFTAAQIGLHINNRSSGATAVAHFRYFRMGATDLDLTPIGGDRIEVGRD